MPPLGIAIAGAGVTVAKGDADKLEPQLIQRAAKVLREIVGERAKRRYVEALDAAGSQIAAVVQARQPVEDSEESRKGLAAPGGRTDQDGLPGKDERCCFRLGLGGAGKSPPEPGCDARMQKVQHGECDQPARQGPVMASVSPGYMMLTKRIRASGEKQAPASSEPL